MLGQTVSHYKILEKLGEGGMGVVYKAEDSKLKRPVALKFLPPHLTQDQEAIERFIYEAQTASSLDHQNICTIYEIDTSDEGRMFIGMAYYDGETLKKKVASDQLSVSSVIEIAIQIAQGLAKAHEKGIIHRDIKPSNVIVQEDGVVKIIDFGLSKLLGTQRLTKSGATLGTAAYMSPEQARGHEVDQCTDLWSLGVVLYEMLTGELPFKGELDQAVIYSILDEQPEPITKRRENVPAELEWIVNKALAKDSSARYQHAGEMLGELQLLKNKIESGTAERLRIGARPARRKKIYLYAGVAVLIILLIGSGLALFNGRDETVDSVAVLPFENATAEPQTDYLSDGVTESLIYSLSQLPRLKVIARSSVFRYKGQALNHQTVARELGVRAVVIGRIALRDSIFSISAELVDSRDNSLLWGRQYNRRLANLLTIQEELAKEISGQLRPELRREEQQQAAKSHTENIAAYQLYLKGRYFWNKRTAEGLNTGIKYFQQAIAKDSAYAKAYAGLTDCYTVLAEETGDPQTEIAKARAAAMKALELDETLAEAHTALGGLLLQHDWNWPAAEKEFKRAIALNPNDATAHQWYSICLEFMGRPDEAIAEAKRAVEVDPLTSIINQSFGYRLYMARQYDRALEQLRQTLEIDSTFSGTYYALGYVYAQKKMYEEAIAAFQKARQLHDHPARLASLGYGYAVSGKRDQAQRIISELKEQAQQRYVSTFDLATIYVGLGEREQTFAWLEKAYEEHNGYLPFLKVDPIWDGLRADPRFAALLKKAGLE